MKKTITISWNEGYEIDLSIPEEPIYTAELIGVLEMCKLVLFENRTSKRNEEDN